MKKTKLFLKENVAGNQSSVLSKRASKIPTWEDFASEDSSNLMQPSLVSTKDLEGHGNFDIVKDKVQGAFDAVKDSGIGFSAKGYGYHGKGTAADDLKGDADVAVSYDFGKLGEQKMNYLEQIIREELAKVLHEQAPAGLTSRADKAFGDLDTQISTPPQTQTPVQQTPAAAAPAPKKPAPAPVAKAPAPVAKKPAPAPVAKAPAQQPAQGPTSEIDKINQAGSEAAYASTKTDQPGNLAKGYEQKDTGAAAAAPAAPAAAMPKRMAGMSTKYLQKRGYKWNAEAGSMVHPKKGDVRDVAKGYKKRKRKPAPGAEVTGVGGGTTGGIAPPTYKGKAATKGQQAAMKKSAGEKPAKKPYVSPADAAQAKYGTKPSSAETAVKSAMAGATQAGREKVAAKPKSGGHIRRKMARQKSRAKARQKTPTGKRKATVTTTQQTFGDPELQRINKANAKAMGTPLKEVIRQEFEKLLQEHAKEYVWGVKAPYSRAANQYQLSVLKHDLLS